ncbi:MAG: P-loop NTPase fold protein, partial [Hafnia sp.]
MKNWFSKRFQSSEERKTEEQKRELEQNELFSDQSDLAKILKAYRLKKKPGYALLITGEWGVGKTYQVTKKYLLKESIYYISLFGLKTAEEIHSSVFAAMHPLQSFIKKGADSLKDTGIEAPGLSLNLGGIAPTLASALLKSECKKDRIIIFDDFERCTVPIQERLGAINIYVEHEECQVIVISNEEKINQQQF